MTTTQATLHGPPVNVGDEVWSFRFGKTVIVEIAPEGFYPIKTTVGSYTSEGIVVIGDTITSLFWQPIDPATLEAARKPPVWEYEYAYDAGNGQVLTTEGAYLNMEELIADYPQSNPNLIKRRT